MVERLFFSKLVTKDLTAVESNRRLFEGVLTVEMKDRQGEITIRDELLKVLPIWLARGGPITDTHSNRVVGQGINFGSTTIVGECGKSYPAITIQGEIYKDYELDNEIWGAIKSGKYKGLSFGGATKSNRTPIMQKDGSMAYSLKDLEQYEVAVCEEPAVPLALITQHNEIAKAMAGDVKERGDGTMCIRCDKFKCYVEKDSLVKIEDDEDDNTQVTVLDEWKNETHPDKNGKTEGIRTTKGDDTYSDTRGPNTPNKDEDAEALENNRGEPQENGATYHGTSKGRTHTCDSDVAEINNVDVGDKATGTPKVQAMDKDDDEMLEEADLEEVEKEDVNNPGSAEYDKVNEAGEKVNRWGKKIPGVMSKKPSEIDTSSDKPGTRHSTRQSPPGVQSRSSPNMSAGQLKRRQDELAGRTGGDKVGDKKIKPRATVTHDRETGQTTIDSSKLRRGSMGITTMPTERYISGIGKSLDILNLLFKIRTGQKLITAREGGKQGVKDSIVGNKKIGRLTESETPGNVNPRRESMEHGSVGDASTSHYQATHLDPEVAEKLKYNKEYNTCEVVREYDDSKKKLENKGTGEAPYTEPGRGGFAGREPGETCDTNESTSIHNVNQPKHVNEPYDDEEAEGVKKNEDPCWEGYEALGMKDQGGKKVPNCVKKTGDDKRPLNKPMRDDGNKKFKVYVRDPSSGNIVTVRFGDPNMEIKRDSPERRSSFRARHKCSEQKDITSAAYWSCKMWEKSSSVSDNVNKTNAELWLEKNDRAMTANNAEDGVNGKMRLDNDPPAEALNEDPEVEKKVQTGDYGNCSVEVEGKNIDAEMNPGASLKKDTIIKDTGVMDPGSGSGGIRTGASYDNAQQDTGQKDNPRKVEEEEYSGEEDRGNLNPKYAGEEDTVTGASRGNYNKATLILSDLLLQLKKQK
jgi:hypothetical protein